jgi:cation diffusion facilitator family transporter
MSAGGSKKVIIISLCANLGIALSKLGGAMLTGSAALLAEAVHSFSDCGNQALLLYGGYAAKKAPTEKFPMGRGKEMFFWSFVVALLLFSMGGAFSLYEGLHKLHAPEPLSHPIVGVSILLVAVGLEAFSFHACLKELQQQNTHGSLWHWVCNTMSADLLVIFLEDLAALLGLSFALVALSLAWITGNPFWDAMGSCFIGVLLIAVAFVLASEVKSMLIGERPPQNYEPRMQSIIETILPGAQVIRLIALQQGVDAVMLAYKIKPATTPADLHSTIDAVNRFEAKVRETFPEVKWQFAELDNKD